MSDELKDDPRVQAALYPFLFGPHDSIPAGLLRELSEASAEWGKRAASPPEERGERGGAAPGPSRPTRDQIVRIVGSMKADGERPDAGEVADAVLALWDSRAPGSALPTENQKMSRLQETFADLSNALHRVTIADAEAESVKLALHRHHVALHEVLNARRGFQASVESLDGKEMATGEGETAEEALHEAHVSLHVLRQPSSALPAGTAEPSEAMVKAACKAFGESLDKQIAQVGQLETRPAMKAALRAALSAGGEGT